MRHILIVCLVVLTSIPALAGGSQPIDVLRNGVEKGIRILNNPEFRDPDRKQEQQQQLRAILGQLFDFPEFSRRVLAAHWNRFTPSQRETFVRVFAEFLGKYYMGELQQRYQDERVVYLGQIIEHPMLADVQVEILWKGQQIPVELRMIKRVEAWKIYDLEVMGIGALSFYREQFKSLLSKETPDQVVNRIKQRIKEMDSKMSAG
jgi:phospholipid transport system substrate-binding protein